MALLLYCIIIYHGRPQQNTNVEGKQNKTKHFVESKVTPLLDLRFFLTRAKCR